MGKYVLNLTGDEVSIERWDGNPITLDEYARISAGLQPYEKQLLRQAALDLAADSKWVLPQTRRDVFNSGPCTYFLQREDLPAQIKIGHTVNLSQRTTMLYHEYKSKIQVVAFAKTAECARFERILHRLFREQGRSEWVDAPPVFEFLREVY